HREDQRTIVRDWNAAAAEGVGFSREFRFVRPGGEIRWVHAGSAPVRDQTGRLMGNVGTLEDITARRHTENELRAVMDELRASEARSRSILDTAVDGVIMIDIEGTIEWFNQAAERIFGYSAEEVIGRNIKMLMPTPYCDEHDEYLRRYAATGKRRLV